MKIIGGRNAGGFFNLGDNRIEMSARDHEDVASGDGELAKRLLLEDHCRGAQFAFLSSRFACGYAAGDDHRVIGFEGDGGGADVKASGLRAFRAMSSRPWDDGAHANREKASGSSPDFFHE